jgi:uncharacterized membrane protein (DUF441 family)
MYICGLSLIFCFYWSGLADLHLLIHIIVLYYYCEYRLEEAILLESTIILMVVLAVAIIGKANSVAIAACILIILKLLHVDQYAFPFLQKNGVFWGLVLLIAAILIPIANGSITTANIRGIFTSWIGITAVVLSFLTTYLSGLGLQYLTVQNHGDIMPALILGSVAAAAFLGGVPVGPLITSGMLAFLLKVLHKS